MTLVALVVTLLIVGVLLGLMNKYLPNQYIPLDDRVKKIINIVVIVAVIIFVLNWFGVLAFINQSLSRVR